MQEIGHPDRLTDVVEEDEEFGWLPPFWQLVRNQEGEVKEGVGGVHELSNNELHVGAVI